LFSSSFVKKPDSSVTHIWSHLEELDPVISQSAPEWPLDKLNPIDLAILRLAAYELIVDKSVPYKVVVDEAVELSKEYGSSNSPGFINGALGNLIKTLKLDQAE